MKLTFCDVSDQLRIRIKRFLYMICKVPMIVYKASK